MVRTINLYKLFDVTEFQKITGSKNYGIYRNTETDTKMQLVSVLIRGRKTVMESKMKSLQQLFLDIGINDSNRSTQNFANKFTVYALKNSLV